ncbi:MAG: FAD/NAD(P)-binding protein [Actinobacteria bacterium]|nr:FAD/NAD(P)-binding protein [Actinomycetota bacterium]
MSEFTTIVTSDKDATNPYLPEIGIIKKVVKETAGIKSFQVVLKDEEKMKRFKFKPGQVAQLSVFGAGESTFAISSSPTRPEYFQFSVMMTGENTSALHELLEGDEIGVRAPLGNWFDYEMMKGKNIVFVGGGIGVAPLRSLILFMLDNRSDYGDLKVIYGARTPNDLCFSLDLKDWQRREDIDLILTVDTDFPGWEGKVGFVPVVLGEEDPSPKNTIAITCGPPIMIKFVLHELERIGFGDKQVITTLERRMKCGIGICGRCNIGYKYICVDGPVFTMEELKELPNEM